MKIVYKVSEEEIKDILAHHFDVRNIYVTLRSEKVTVGYGMSERSEKQIVADVDMTYYGKEDK